MRLSAIVTTATLTVGVLLGAAGAAGAVVADPDAESNVVVNHESFMPAPGHLGDHNMGIGNWNSGASFGPMIMD